jgi:hypothetical protein
LSGVFSQILLVVGSDHTFSSESILIGRIWWKTVLTTMDRPVVFSPIGSPNSIIFIIYWWAIDVDCDWMFDCNSYIKAMTNLPAKTMCCCITEIFEQLWVFYWTFYPEPWFFSILICLRVHKYGSMLWLEDGNLYLRVRKMSHTIYAANGKVSHIPRRMCEWDYTIDKSLVCLQSEIRTSCWNFFYLSRNIMLQVFERFPYIYLWN